MLAKKGMMDWSLQQRCNKSSFCRVRVLHGSSRVRVKLCWTQVRVQVQQIASLGVQIFVAQVRI